MSSLDIEDPEALIAYLRRGGRIGADETPTVTILSGGVSNRTVWLGRSGGRDWVIKQALEKLRVELDWFSSPMRVHREAQGLRWLARLVPEGATPPLIFEDFEHHLLAMGAVPKPHDNWKTLLLAGALVTDHVEKFARLLARIHGGAHAWHDEIAREFEDRSFFETLRLEAYYGYSATRVEEAAAFLGALIEKTRSRRLTLVHGDFSPKNVLVRDGELILLDHEVMHFGDPAFDLGFAMTHLLSKAHFLRAQRPAFLEAARVFWKTYVETLGEFPWSGDLEQRAVEHTLGCCLARVCGRSPLEYLDRGQRTKQRRIVTALIEDAPDSVEALIAGFTRGLNDADD
ncbi:MAG: phosphotransferase family protein [Candidatus Binatia bacterium]